MPVTAKQIQKLDKMAIERFGIPSVALMENAGRAVAQQAARLLKAKRKVCIVCGFGNNAGDGFVAARHLINNGYQVTVVLIGKPAALKRDAAVNYAILRKSCVPIVRAKADGRAILPEIRKADIIVDAIFGVGLNRDIQGSVKGIIESINKEKKMVLAVDAPSGLDVTTGKIFGACIKAHTTVTFTFTKKGFKALVGPQYTGRIIVADIGIPKALHRYCR